jgi:tRNA pseudouridine38-40 synthase
VVHFDTQAERALHQWRMGINHHLPSDISVSWLAEVGEDFHARFSAYGRRYVYVINNRATPHALLNQRTTWIPYALDAEKMHQAAQALVGEQDFSAFRASMCQAKHPVREVRWVKVHRQGDFVFIQIEANAFLHHMVRNIAGSLLAIGRGHQQVDWVAQLLAGRDRTQAAATASGDGLYFETALYPEFFGIPQTRMDLFGELA